MATHEFGIMRDDPVPGERYDTYEPELYFCIAVDDDFIEEIEPKWRNLDFYYHTLDWPAKGLDYAGITLIPPETAVRCLAALEDRIELVPLRDLFRQASAQNKFIIHYGL